MIKIGISASFFHADPGRPIFKGMTLQYIEQNIAHWLMQRAALAFMIPSPDGHTRREGSRVTLDAYAEALDGLVLMAARTSARPPTARLRSVPSGPATASATTTRSRCCVPSWNCTSRCSASAEVRR